MLGFCEGELKPLGPDHEYVAPPMATCVKLSVPFKQIGELLPAVGVGAAGFTVTLITAAGLVQPSKVWVTE